MAVRIRAAVWEVEKGPADNGPRSAGHKVPAAGQWISEMAPMMIRMIMMRPIP